MAQVIVVIDDDEVSRGWAQCIDLGKPVLTSTGEKASDLIHRLGKQMHAILVNSPNHEQAFWIVSLASYFSEGSLYTAGIISATLPDHLDKAVYVVNGTPVILSKQDDFVLEDAVMDWVALYESLTARGPILAVLRE
ncbi:MAG: hypothetical protein OYG31_01590 [Candidatus Kaiserbacteria bacterium]|nr:hypothetical protein [Candidatus Kaiserbacteria bacterium]